MRRGRDRLITLSWQDRLAERSKSEERIPSAGKVIDCGVGEPLPVSLPVADSVCAAAVFADYDWGEEFYGAGGARGVAGAGDRGGDRGTGGSAVLSGGKLSLPAGAGERAD